MIRPYPSVLPSESWALVKDLVQGKAEFSNANIHVAVETFNFAVGKVFPDGPVVSGQPLSALRKESEVVSKDEMTAICDRMAVGNVSEGASAIPWKKVLNFLAKLLLENLIGSETSA